MKRKLEFLELSELKLKKQKEEDRELLGRRTKEKWNKIESFKKEKRTVIKY